MKNKETKERKIDKNNITSSKKSRKNRKKRNKVARVFLSILLIIVIVLGVLGVRFAMRVDENGGGLQGIIATVLGQDKETLKNLEPIYCLVMGESTGLTDTIMLCAYNPRTQEGSILSIPRDTYYGTDPNNATPYYKINALYSQGPERTLAEVEKIVGFEIPYYIVISTRGVIDMVDLIGGVEFDVPIDMYYHDPSQALDIDIKAGKQVLNGDDAEGLLRFRHNDDWSSYPSEYGDNDLGRMKTQREFVKAAISQTVTAKNLPKVNSIIEKVFENIETNMTMDDIINYVPYTVNFNLDELKTETLPGTPATLNDYSFFLHDSYATQNIVDDLFTFSDEIIENSTIGEGVSLEILNGSEDTKAMIRLEKLLKSAGYDIVRKENTTDIENTVIINRKNSNDSSLTDLNSIIKTNNITVGEELDGIDYTIVIGKDYSY